MVHAPRRGVNAPSESRDSPASTRTDWASHELLVVREITRRLARSLEPDHVIREMLHLLSELLGLNRGRVLLYDADRAELAIQHAYGLTRTEMGRGRFAVGEGITGQVFAAGRAVIVQDIDAEPAFLCRTVDRARLPQETVAYIALPVEIGGRVGGVLGAHRLRRRDRALSDDLHILQFAAMLIGQVLDLNRAVAERTAKLEQENRKLRAALDRAADVGGAAGIIGRSPALLAALRQIERVAGTDATVLLLGESGTGKELLARALHLASNRRDAPFVNVNCAAIPAELFESELFGHEKGAFTGATAARAGKFEQAHGGTLFLDEIGELPVATQAKLLRALQERMIQRVGAIRERHVDVRIVAATNRDLQALVSAGRFRLDLFYRLNVVPVTLPPLRERQEDVRELVRHFVSRLDQAYQRNVSLAPEALLALERFSWPGNVRQLANVIERLVLLEESGQVGAAAVEQALASEGPAAEPAVPGGLPRYAAVDAGDRQRIEAALAGSAGNKTAAARVLGMTLRQLDYRVRQLRIDVAVYRG
jgi:Nif-specific regulatory protein